MKKQERHRQMENENIQEDSESIQEEIIQEEEVEKEQSVNEDNNKYILVVGTFSVEENAKRQAVKLNAKYRSSKGRHWVYVFSSNNRQEVEDYKATYGEGWVNP